MAKDFVTVRILDLPGTGAGCACSSAPRGPEFIAALMHKCEELNQALEGSYPGQTSTEYIDISKFPEEKKSQAGQLLTSKQYPSPLVVIDCEPRFAGSIQVNKVVKEVGKILKG